MSGKTIVMTSGKGGVGKTTATANVGTALALRSNRVVVIDTDIGLRNLDVVMGLENRIVYDLVDVVEERCRIEQALIRDKHAGELYLVAAAQTRDKDCITAEQLVDLCRRLELDFDYVIVDCPAGIEQGFRNAIAAAREALVGDDARGISDPRRRPGDRLATRQRHSFGQADYQPHQAGDGSARRHAGLVRRPGHAGRGCHRAGPLGRPGDYLNQQRHARGL